MHHNYPIKHLANRDRYDYFTSLVDELFCPMDCDLVGRSAGDFSATLAATDIGDLRLANVSTTPIRVRRRRHHISRITDAPFLIKFQLAGESRWFQRGQSVHLGPGDFVICSTAEPYSLEMTGPYEMPVLAIDDKTMRSLTSDPEQFLGQKMPFDDVCCGLLSRFVADVIHRLPQLPASMIPTVESNILDLLGGVLSTRTGGSDTVLPRPDNLDRLKGFIQQNLRDPGLGVPMIASAFGVSTRQVHKLFEPTGVTPLQYVRQLRLEAVRRQLSDPNHLAKSITDIALYWGFYDLPHLTRCFRQTFGVTPSQYRQRIRFAKES